MNQSTSLRKLLLRVHRDEDGAVSLETILIIGAIVTPPDPLSQVLISFPLFLLYEISIFISAYVVSRRRRRVRSRA